MMIRLFHVVACLFVALILPAFAGDDDATTPVADPAPQAGTSSAVEPFSADTVTKQYFGRIPHDGVVSLYTLTNKAGMSVSVMDYGATITGIRVPDKDGKIDDVALGFDKFSSYLAMKDYFGATIGRYANRIAHGRFTLDKINYKLATNDGPNALHGGVVGFNRRLWNFEQLDSEVPAVRLTYLSKDGEEGYPGNLFVSVTFSLTEDNELRITYSATTDKSTVLNLTNHSYFNLGGPGGTILDELVTINADKFTPVDETLIPTGEITDVAGTPYDFRRPTPVGAHIKELNDKPEGYDFNYVLDKGFFSFSRYALAATVQDPKTGRRLDVYTDQPGLQFYTGNFLTGSYVGREHKKYPQYGAICLETQHFPDSPNHDNFPTTVLRPGEEFKSTTVYKFSVEK